jgi:cysteine desulfurase
MGLLVGQRRLGHSPSLIVSAIDHSAVLRVAQWWTSEGGTVHTVGVDSQGHIDAEELVSIAESNPSSVVSIQWANPEVGTVQPVEHIGAHLVETGAHLLRDATSAVGRMSLPTVDGVAVVAADALSWGGPRGVAALGIRDTSAWFAPQPHIADEAVAALIVAAASSLEAALASMAIHDQRARNQIARVRQECAQSIPDLDIPGDPDNRLPHVLTMSALYLDGESLVQRLDSQGLALGSGSACMSDSGEPSHVLAAMGALTGGNLRLSLPAGLPDEPIDRLIEILPGIVEELRAPL